MLKKLIKYDLRATARILLPVWACAAVLAVAASILNRFHFWFSSLENLPLYRLLNGILGFAMALGILAALVVCVVVNVQRFYRMLGDQGYLMFTLPARTSQHMASKLITAVGWTAATFAGLAGLLSLLSLLDPEGEVVASSDFAAVTGLSPAAEFWVEYGGFALVLVLMLAGMAFGYLLLYLCMTIGTRWPQQRLFASIISYFVISTVLQILVVAGLAVFGYTLYASGGYLDLMYMEQAVYTSDTAFITKELQIIFTVLGGIDVLLILLDGALWAVIHHFLNRKLNLA